MLRTIKHITFSDTELDELDARADTDIGVLIEKQRKETVSRERDKMRVEADLAYIRSHRLTLPRAGTFTP